MGMFLIEFSHEGIEFVLLLQAVHARRPGGFFLLGQMHALVSPVLLGWGTRLGRASAILVSGQGATPRTVRPARAKPGGDNLLAVLSQTGICTKMCSVSR